jgi:hypothetical protein
LLVADTTATSDSIEARYLELLWELQRRRWETYANGAAFDLTDLSTAFHDLSQSARHVRFRNDARDRLLERIMQRTAVDHHPQVASLANRLAEWSNYATVPATTTPAWRRSLSEAMESDVIDLLTVRRRLAEDLGFASYGHLVADSEGFDLDAMIAFAAAQRTTHLAVAAGLYDSPSPSVSYLDISPAKAGGERNASVATWFDWLGCLAGGGEHDAVDEAQRLTSELGLDDLSSAISWSVREQQIAGYDCAVSVLDDIRLLVRPVVSNDGLSTVFHELGHGLAHAANEAKGIFKTWNSLSDESMAVVMEHIGVALRFPPEARAKAKLISQLEAARMATSFLFEVDVNDDPRQARSLYRKWYEPLVDVEDPVVWASDSFRIDDPFHIHTYLIGRVVATATVAFLQDRFDNDHQKWGTWLRRHYYRDGRQRSLFEKISGLEEHCPPAVLALKVR